MRATLGAAAVVLTIAFPAPGQRLTVGATAGTHFTHTFPPSSVRTSPSPLQFDNGPRSLIYGVTLEGRFNDTFSLEANALRRPLKADIMFEELLGDGTRRAISATKTSARAWEFPLLLKYTMRPVRIANARPFVTGGVSFRSREDPVDVQPSFIGATVGAGFTLPVGRFRLAPTLRYTRWRTDPSTAQFSTRSDQLEFLTSLGYETRKEARRFAGRKAEIGALVGAPLTRGVQRLDSLKPGDESFRYLVGLSAQVEITERLTIEGDGIYKPLRVHGPSGGSEQPASVILWQFPLLAKYRLRSANWAPFVSGGPSLRFSGNRNGFDPSRVGATVGVGVERRVGIARWSSSLRYTRWRSESAPFRTAPNAAEIIVGVSF